MASSLVFVALLGCDDDCPGPATVATSGTATWCETAQGVRSGAYSVVDNGVVRVEGHYDAGEEDGQWAWFWPDGSLHERGMIRLGERVGDWERQAEDGTSLPLTRYGRATTETEGVVLQNAHPDPSVFTTTWLGAPVYKPAKIAGLIVAPQATGLVALDPDSGEVLWQINSPSRLTDRPLGSGLRTAVAFTERGGVLVARLGDEVPSFQVYELGAADTPPPVANDFGVVYVDASGTLQDHAFEDALRPVPDLSPSALAVAGDRLLIGTADGTVAQWDRVAGTLTWSVSIGGPVTELEAPNWETVMVASGDTWYGLDFTTGVQQWEQGRTPTPKTAAHSVGVRARLDHPSAPLMTSEGAWIGTRAGLLVHLLDLPLGTPEQRPWSGRVLTSLNVGTAAVASADWESWQVPSVGAVRTALPLGDQRGGETELTTHWFDLPPTGGTRQLTWADGWEHNTQRAWHLAVGDVDIWTQQTPPPTAPQSGDWVIDGWAAKADDWVASSSIIVRVGPETTTITADDWSQSTANTTPNTWRATLHTTARWTGVPVAPWVVAWTASPRGWGGWQHAAAFTTVPAPESDVLQTELP